MTLADALREARAANVERLDAQLLLARLLGRPRSWLLAHDDAMLNAEQTAAWRDLLARRAAGEPLAYLLGEKEFHGLMLQVDSRVLVPRPETEHLVDWALELLAGPLRDRMSPRVVDLGTGSGAIAIAVKHAWPTADVTATDASEAALTVAGDNAQRLGLAIRCAAGSWWDAVPHAANDAGFDLGLSNPPYIAGRDSHLLALRHEPAAALTPGGDGLDALRAIVAGAPQRLARGGWLLVEHGFDQGDAVRTLLRTHGFAAIETRSDLAGHPRCSAGQRR
ncbi:MAG TPA: peptide chain release factor N(5)-glutamine methyltransferase [Burkholderiaceae bacterium]|nr:peptide chain release factor N(5)-glutamine methyltransferase [Burkholderiaceae bacterium]